MIRGARVFDGVAVTDADSVVVRDGLIAEVGVGLPAPEGAEVVDAPGGTLLPGLIDAHSHVLRVADLAQALVFGVTTELDMFCVPDLLGPLRAAASRRDDIADIRSAGIGATAPGGHPAQLVEAGVYPPFPTVASVEEAAGFVAERVRDGSDYLKIFLEDGSAGGWGNRPHLEAGTVAALVAAGHAAGLPVVAHITTQVAAQRCVAAGVDGLAHLFVNEPPTAAFVDQAVAAGIFAVPTVTIFEELYRTTGRRREAAYVDRPRLWPYLDPTMRSALLGDWPDHVRRPPGRASAEYAGQAARELHQAGVPILAGTDVVHPLAAHGLSLHAELAALVDAGLSPAAALASATSNPAAAFGLTDRGRIAPGLRADLLLVEGDPTSDITATGDITDIWRRGQRLDRDAHRTTQR